MDLKYTDIIYTDVAVIGGGTAGVFAAVSAAECGAKTLIIERSGALGGTMTTGGVCFPGLFFAWGKQIIDGPCRKAIKRAEQLGGCEMPKISYKPERHWMEQIHINPFVWEYVLDEMCRERNADIMLYSSLAAAEEMADGIDIAVCAKDGMKLIRAKFAVDASGDACLVRAAGGEFEVIGEPQPSTLQNLCSGYNMAAVSRDGLIAECDAAIRDGKLPAYVNGGQIYNWLQKGSIELHTPAENSHTATGGTETEINARENLMRMYLFLRTVDGLENFYIKYTAASTGIRESVRIIGEKTVTEEEYLAAVKYDDAVCYSFYPIDRHVPDGVEQVFLGDGKVPTVPYGAMIAKGTKRIITAGRCISSDRNAGSALRVQATCMAEGQAAGCAAAVCLRDDTQAKTVDMEKLKKQLRDIGAIVP